MPFEGPPQAVFDVVLLFDQGVHVAVVELEGVAPGLLGGVHGDLGVAQQFLVAVAMFREAGDADAGADEHFAPLQVDGRAQLRKELARQLMDLLVVTGFGDEEHELVAAEAGEHILGRQVHAEAHGHGLQDQVAEGMSEGIVDPLETIEVDVQQRQLQVVLAGVFERLVDAVLEEDPVAQTGEGVEVGEAARTRFGLFPFGDVDPDGEAADEFPLFVVLGHGGKEDVELFSVLAHHGVGDVRHLAIAEEAGEGRAFRLAPRALVEEVEQGAADDLFFLVAELVEPGLADADQLAMAVDRVKHHRGVLVELAVALFVGADFEMTAAQAQVHGGEHRAADNAEANGCEEAPRGCQRQPEV